MSRAVRVNGGLLVVALFVVSMFSGCFAGSGSVADDGADPDRVRGANRTAPVYPGEYKFDGQWSQTVAVGLYKELPFEHLTIQSDLDDADIEIGIWRPDVPEDTKVPIILQASPYYGNLGAPMAQRAGVLFMLIENFVPHGYAVAAVSVRGTGASGGCMDLMGVKEIADLDQAITWLGTQAWTNGNIGMTGLSYDGSTPWSAAATGNPHVKTIVPISGVPDLYGLMFRNGTAESRGPFLLNLLYYVFFLRVYLPGFPPSEVPVYAVEKSFEGAVCPESWTGLGAALYSGATGERDPLGWWAERNRMPLVEENYKGSVFSVQGLQDWNVDPHMVIPWVDELDRLGLETKQLLGQWGHSYPDSYCSNQASTLHKTCRWDYAEILLHWFEHYLYENPTIDTGPAVQVQDHTMRWRNEDHYPPRDANWTTLHLATNQRLALDPGAYGEVLLTATALLPETGAASNKENMPGYSADFDTERLDKGMLIAGLPRLHITVTPQSTSGHLAAHLYEVTASGDETRIGWTQINLDFADGTETRRPVTPGQPIVAKMEFQPMDAYVREGNHLRLRVWESTYSDRLPTIPPGPITLQFGADVSSVLELPLVERTAADFFEPPFAQS